MPPAARRDGDLAGLAGEGPARPPSLADRPTPERGTRCLSRAPAGPVGGRTSGGVPVDRERRLRCARPELFGSVPVGEPGPSRHAVRSALAVATASGPCGPARRARPVSAVPRPVPSAAGPRAASPSIRSVACVARDWSFSDRFRSASAARRGMPCVPRWRSRPPSGPCGPARRVRPVSAGPGRSGRWPDRGRRPRRSGASPALRATRALRIGSGRRARPVAACRAFRAGGRDRLRPVRPGPKGPSGLSRPRPVRSAARRMSRVPAASARLDGSGGTRAGGATAGRSRSPAGRSTPGPARRPRTPAGRSGRSRPPAPTSSRIDGNCGPNAAPAPQAGQVASPHLFDDGLASCGGCPYGCWRDTPPQRGAPIWKDRP